MSVRGLCHICLKPADFICKSCHEPTCANHIGEFGLCIACQRAGKRI